MKKQLTVRLICIFFKKKLNSLKRKKNERKIRLLIFHLLISTEKNMSKQFFPNLSQSYMEI